MPIFLLLVWFDQTYRMGMGKQQQQGEYNCLLAEPDHIY